jgi:hypothetical protein
MNEKLQKIKDELMQPGWTEDLHKSLENMPKGEAKQIVESMNDLEINRKVNNRNKQEDYIADYLGFLWEISETAFWRHVKMTLSVKHGMLWADHWPHIDKMRSMQIPDEIFYTVMDFAINCDEKRKDDINLIGCIVKAQADRFGRKKDIEKVLAELPEDKRQKSLSRIQLMLDKECNY